MSEYLLCLSRSPDIPSVVCAATDTDVGVDSDIDAAASVVSPPSASVVGASVVGTSAVVGASVVGSMAKKRVYYEH